MEKRIAELEIRVTEQERIIEELSYTVAEQWKKIDSVQQKLNALTERFLTLEEQSQADISVTRPPHW